MGFLGKYPKIEILATTTTNTQGRLDVIIIFKTTPGSSLNGYSFLQLFLTILQIINFQQVSYLIIFIEWKKMQ